MVELPQIPGNGPCTFKFQMERCSRTCVWKLSTYVSCFLGTACSVTCLVRVDGVLRPGEAEEAAESGRGTRGARREVLPPLPGRLELKRQHGIHDLKTKTDEIGVSSVAGSEMDSVVQRERERERERERG